MRTLVAAVLLLTSAASAQAQRVVARVIDSESRGPLTEVTVRLLDGDSAVVGSAVTGGDGFFTLTAPARGEYRLLLERLGYATRLQRVNVNAADVSMPAIMLKPEALRMEAIEAEGRRVRADTATGLGQRSSHLVAGARLARLASMGVSGQGLVRELGGGLRVRNVGQGICVESTRRVMSITGPTGSGGCDWVAVIIDGALAGDPTECTRQATCAVSQFFRGFRATDWESIEYLPPLEAGQRYGLTGSAAGALVVWTRGLGPYRSAARDTIF